MDVRSRDPQQLALPAVTLDWDLGFVSPELKQALAYWRSCCGSRKRPERAELKPKNMSKFLKHLALVEVQAVTPAARAYRVRLAGSSVEQVYGQISGQSIDEALPSAIAARWQKYLDAVCQADRPLRLTGRVGFQNKSWISGEILLAPLGSESGPISTIFAAFDWQHDTLKADSSHN